MFRESLDDMRLCFLSASIIQCCTSLHPLILNTETPQTQLCIYRLANAIISKQQHRIVATWFAATWTLRACHRVDMTVFVPVMFDLRSLMRPLATPEDLSVGPGLRSDAGSSCLASGSSGASCGMHGRPLSAIGRRIARGRRRRLHTDQREVAKRIDHRSLGPWHLSCFSQISVPPWPCSRPSSARRLLVSRGSSRRAPRRPSGTNSPNYPSGRRAPPVGGPRHLRRVWSDVRFCPRDGGLAV